MSNRVSVVTYDTLVIRNYTKIENYMYFTYENCACNNQDRRPYVLPPHVSECRVVENTKFVSKVSFTN